MKKYLININNSYSTSNINNTKIGRESKINSFKNYTKMYKFQHNKDNNYQTSVSSNELDIDKQDNILTKKYINPTDTTFPIIKVNKSEKIISINKRLIHDLNYQINRQTRKVFGNDFKYKQTINLQELNDYYIYEQTKKDIEKNKSIGKKNSVDFRTPLIYRRIANHYKKEDLVPMKIRPKINLEEVLVMHNSIFRKAMMENKCQNYYLKNNVKLRNILRRKKYK